MKKERLFILFFMTIVLDLFCQNQDVIAMFKEHYPNLEIYQILETSLVTNKKKEQVIIHEKEKPFGYFDDPDSVDSKIIKIESDGSITFEEFVLDCLNYNEYLLSIEDVYNYDLPNWNGYISVYDYNHDGIDEVLTVSLWGVGLELMIYSFANGAERTILDDHNYTGWHIKNIEFLDQEETFIVTRVQPGDDHIPYLVSYPYIWNAELKEFILDKDSISREQYEK